MGERLRVACPAPDPQWPYTATAFEHAALTLARLRATGCTTCWTIRCTTRCTARSCVPREKKVLGWRQVISHYADLQRGSARALGVEALAGGGARSLRLQVVSCLVGSGLPGAEN